MYNWFVSQLGKKQNNNNNNNNLNGNLFSLHNNEICYC